MKGLPRIEDPRNAVGLFVDVGETLLESASTHPVSWPPVRAQKRRRWLKEIEQRLMLGRDFARAPRWVINGYRRRGASGLYQRLKSAQEGATGALVYRYLQRVDVYADDVSRAVLRSALGAMEGYWDDDCYLLSPDALRDEVLSIVVRYAPSWYYRDVAGRKHHGKATRDAFEAAWIAGEYAFAYRLLGKELRE